MFGFTSTGVVIALGVALVVLLFLLVDARKPKRAEKWEKAAIMKQLLERSDQEGLRQQATAPRPRTSPAASAKTARPNPSMKRQGKPAFTTQSKAR